MKRNANEWPRFSLQSLLIVTAICAVLFALPHLWRTIQYYRFAEDLDVLRVELKNPNYRWYGPTSGEDRIPFLHAARALAFMGDDAVPILIEAAKDPEIDIISINDALSEIGIPVHEFHNDIMNRNMQAVEQWWRENRKSTGSQRSRHRERIGLPPVR